MRGYEVITINDLFLTPFFLVLIFIYARMQQKRHIEKFPEYKYYLPGLFLKIFGGISVCLVYAYYYLGGDTIAYFVDGIIMTKFFFKDPQNFFRLIIYGGSNSDLLLFDSSTGYPNLIYDSYAFFVVRFTCLLTLLGFRSFLVTTILLAWISFGGLWRLFRVYTTEFTEIIDKIAIGFFFIPSLFFWGSGLLKDTITMSFMAYFVSSFYMAFILKRKVFSNILMILFASFIILSIKPYIFVGLLPGVVIWLISNLMSKIKGSIVKIAALPIFLILIAGFGFVLLNVLGSSLGQYNLDSILVKATETQKDLKRDAYMGNSFDIGNIEPNFPSMLAHAHLAIFAAIFRPTLLEANNIVMLASAIENTFFLYITLAMLFRLRFFGFFKYLFGKNHLLTFSLTFSLFFSFSVGITTSNFGSLVRYKIPFIPFYISSIYIINYYHRKEKQAAIELKKEEIYYAFK